MYKLHLAGTPPFHLQGRIEQREQREPAMLRREMEGNIPLISAWPDVSGTGTVSVT